MEGTAFDSGKIGGKHRIFWCHFRHINRIETIRDYASTLFSDYPLGLAPTKLPATQLFWKVLFQFSVVDSGAC